MVTKCAIVRVEFWFKLDMRGVGDVLRYSIIRELPIAYKCSELGRCTSLIKPNRA